MGFGCLWLLALAATAQLVPIPEFGVRLAPGFRISLFSGPDLANDIYAMTLDARGNVVVTSQGYIRTLLDTDRDGRADSSTLFAATRTGGMGMCFDGPSLYFVGDGALFRFDDTNGDGVADGPPQRLLSMEFLEHGGHAVRKGPDGWIYVIVGNETTITNEHAKLPGSPIIRAEAGALLRLTPDGSACEIISHGFRNPYDFDFNSWGDLFTYDSDVEADYFLPWYTPTRIYHIAFGGHHSWRLPGWRRGWNLPDYYPDVVDIMARIGRGSPTGVVCYRHIQFPERYRDGVFACDWTFGRIYFLPLTGNGSSYQTTPEVFLEPIGAQGFAPSDIAVSVDGALLVSIGGRKTRGAVYRIEYAQRDALLRGQYWTNQFATLPLAAVGAPQPLDAWSRAFWEPLANQYGSNILVATAVSGGLLAGTRVRAIEMLTQLYGGLPPGTAFDLARANSPEVRARTAWSLGRVPTENYEQILTGLSRDNDPFVRRVALEAILDRLETISANTLQQAANANIAHPDKRVRQAAAHLATYLSPQAIIATDTQARLTAIQAMLGRERLDTINTNVIVQTLAALEFARGPNQQLEAIRLIIAGLGDWNLHHPSVEVYTAYEPAFSLEGHNDLVARIRRAARALTSAGSPNVEFEAARLLAMVRDNDPVTPPKLVLKFNERTTPGSDVHYLTVLSRLTAPLATNHQVTIVNTLLSLDRKLEGQQMRSKQYWGSRLAELVGQFVARHPTMADLMLRHPNFVSPGHVAIVPSLGPAKRLPAARLFAAQLRKRPTFIWTPQFIDLLSALPPEEAYPLFRPQWNNPALREDITIRLSARPEVVDADKFMTGLASPRADVVVASASALLQLPPNAKSILPVVKTIQRHLTDPKDQALRSMLVTLINHEAGTSFSSQEPGTQSIDIKKAFQPIFDWFRKQYPALTKQLDVDTEDTTNWAAVLAAVPWDKGDPSRGENIFVQRGCQTCHASSTPLGPDLAGAARRFSPYDLFQAIVYPSRDIAPQYRPVNYQTRGGGTYLGVPVFESPDGVILQTSSGETVRLAEEDITSRAPANVSLMPAGLLNGLSRLELADLYAYLARLQPAR
ncbi:MAG TPA: PVC-type heme-binding CxxCH protein [Verrucomicrobiae bacterium]|nr:PVC-type heme-binding CxxCH protein [Verrucomicrobiae bacterium]